MQFSTTAFLTAALLVSSALALPNESAPGERKAYYKGGRRFRKSNRPCTTSSSVLPVTTAAPTTALAVAAVPEPSPEPVIPAPEPPVEDKVVFVTTTLAPEPVQTTPPPAPPPAPEPTPTPPPVVQAPAAPQSQAPAEVKVESTPTPAPVTAAPASGLSSDEQKALDAHNAARAAVGQKPLAWDAGLAADAKSWAQNLVSVGSLQHSTSGQRGDQGENLYWQSHDKTPCNNAADSWASEVSLYNGQPIGQGDFAAYGHYTQMIWKSTTKVGLGIANDGKGGVYVVARYNPAGNFVGQTPTR